MVAILRSEVVQAREGIGALARPWEARGSIDIEALAIWAYRDQLVDRFARTGLHAIEAECMGYESTGSSSDGCAALARIDHMGCRIDHAGQIVCDQVHPVAYAVAGALGSVEHGDRVAFHARAATRPSGWERHQHNARASVWVKPWEEAQVEYQGPGRKGGFCPVILLNDPSRIEWGRRDYLEWWAALEAAAWEMSLRPLDFHIVGPTAPREPWHG